ncbi:MAG: hypothetical protein KVP17_003218 [Porospora cf. gigantea B]|uniref:uncharacterized protein n=1 Tax=Porospora cf. gigantea B TaxID=2853592 RepID=UPI003571AE3C|nr:MAG: hypothetical protein KVP17_003218 [Porospora cf. gigantea B]
MATLADSFLEDLEELEEVEEVELGIWDWSDEETIPDAVELYVAQLASGSTRLSTLLKEEEFLSVLSECQRSTLQDAPVNDEAAEYDLVKRSNQMVVKVDVEILNIFRFVKDAYARKFPELESIVFSPLEYVSVVMRLRNAADVTQVELGDVLPNATIMAVAVAASMSVGSPLPPMDLEQTMEACREALHLADARAEILRFVESRMQLLAPNLTRILGPAIGARLITLAGGIHAMARMPSQQLMLLGRPKKSSVGHALTGAALNSGLLAECDIHTYAPANVKSRALKLLAGKCALASRVDSFGSAKDGSVGEALKQEILSKLVKAQEPPNNPIRKALPVPDERPKPKRGGKRHRKRKEKYGLTDEKRKEKRLTFGPEKRKEYEEDEDSED